MALAPAGVLSFAQSVNVIDAASERAASSLERRSLAAVDEERAAFESIKQAIRFAAVAAQVELTKEEDCETSLASLLQESPWAVSAIILSKTGGASCGADEATDFTDEPGWLRFIEDPQYVISPPGEGRVSDGRVFLAYQPLPRATEDIFALAVGIDITFLQKASQPEASDPIFAFLDRSGETIFAGHHFSDEGVDWLPNERAALLTFGDRRVEGQDSAGSDRIFFTSALEAGQLWAVTSIKKPTRADILFSKEGRLVLIPIVIWFVAVAVAYFTIDSLVTKHVRRLAHVARRVGRGDFSTKGVSHEGAPLEIGELSASIQAMAKNLAQRDEKLNQTLDMQRRLLLEVHHRVKNNLQTISSLMNLESRRSEDPEGRAVLKAIQDRIYSLAMVHQNLYATENLEAVALDQLASDICRHLETSLAPSTRRKKIELNADEVVIGTVAATPIALFLSEAIGNAFKHGDADGVVSVHIERGEDEFSITVINSRPPHGRPTSDEDVSGLGLKLMERFAKQIAGQFTCEASEKAFSVSITAPIKPPAELFSVRHTDRANLSSGNDEATEALNVGRR